MLCDHCQYIFKTKFCLGGAEIVWNRKVKTLLSGRDFCRLCKILFDWLPKEGPNDTLLYTKKSTSHDKAIIKYFLKV
jgi:hypothetical protein